MKSIETVLRMRSPSNLHREMSARSDAIGYHGLERGQTCFCDHCKPLREEMQRIADRIKELGQ